MKAAGQHPMNASPASLWPLALALVCAGLSLWIANPWADVALLVVSAIAAVTSVVFAFRERMWLVVAHAGVLAGFDAVMLLAG